jgi:protein phosphatase PTC1
MMQLWDVCSDQEAVDLIRDIPDPQVASKALVDHALSRFSTDNLSCMVVRFDSSAVKARKDDSSVGVEGDQDTAKGGVSEADAIVSEAKKREADDAQPTETERASTTPETIPEESEMEAEQKDVEPTKSDPDAPMSAAENS